ncbi:hypothetical protein [Pyrococcus yayanosii]|uniref:hypothetical protein n=1 Tax=Pyrococcus yayanosii TaxID=1008460 RepID=UPI00064FAB09|nr:hypothetical protein [Pyrococcus yayanosii]
MIRRARIEDEDILEEIHAGEPPWENFEVYLKAIRNSGGDIFLYEDKGEIELSFTIQWESSHPCSLGARRM